MNQGRADLQTSDTLVATSAPSSGPSPRRSIPAACVLPGARRVERFEFVAPLGIGGEGEVWRVRDHDLARDVAVKRGLHPQPERLAAEARVAATLEHPGIVPIHDAGVDAEGHPYVVMRCIDGESLESIIERLAAGEPEAHVLYCFERRMAIFRRLCEAVMFAHARGIIHGDIKPANVIVGHFGEVFLTDWGVARRTGEGPSGTVSGTPAYMSPEQARGAILDARSDVFSLCATLFELLTLRTWIEGSSVVDLLHRIPTTRPTHPSDVASPYQPRVPMDLGWFVLRGLCADPAARFSGVPAMIARLDMRAEGIVPVQCTQTAVKRTLYEVVRLLERRPVLLPFGIGLACLLVIIGMLAR